MYNIVLMKFGTVIDLTPKSLDKQIAIMESESSPSADVWGTTNWEYDRGIEPESCSAGELSPDVFGPLSIQT